MPFFDEVSVPRGMVIAEEGRLCHEFVVVAAGELEVCRKGRATRLGPGGSFGWSAIQERAHYNATVVATSPARLLVMSHAQFRAAEALAGQPVRPVRSYTGTKATAAHDRPAA